DGSSRGRQRRAAGIGVNPQIGGQVEATECKAENLDAVGDVADIEHARRAFDDGDQGKVRRTLCREDRRATSDEVVRATDLGQHNGIHLVEWERRQVLRHLWARGWMDADPDPAPPMKFTERPGNGLPRLGRALKRYRVFEIKDAHVGADRDSL